MEMTRLQGGLHQAIEAKEGLKANPRNKGHGAITYQISLRCFKLEEWWGLGVAEAEPADTYGHVRH